MHVPLGDLCRSNGVNPSTFYRWGQPDANPRLRTMFTALDGMEAELAVREAALVEDIRRGEP